MIDEELGAKVRRLQQAVDEVHGHTYLDGVSVRTDANGRLTELVCGHEAWGRGPEVLAETIMRAYRQTADDVLRRSTSIMAELRDDPIVARIVDATDSRSDPECGSERPFDATGSVAWSPRPSHSGEISVEQQDLSGASYIQSVNREVDDREDGGDAYFHRKSWLE